MRVMSEVATIVTQMHKPPNHPLRTCTCGASGDGVAGTDYRVRHNEVERARSREQECLSPDSATGLRPHCEAAVVCS